MGLAEKWNFWAPVGQGGRPAEDPVPDLKQGFPLFQDFVAKNCESLTKNSNICNLTLK